MTELTVEVFNKRMDDVTSSISSLVSKIGSLETRQAQLEYRVGEMARSGAATGPTSRVGMYPGLQPFELDGASVAGGAFVPASYPKLR